MRLACLFVLTLSIGFGQRVVEENGSVIYIDEHSGRANLGPGFAPSASEDGKILFIRGPRILYGEDFDCANPTKKNSIVQYDPVMRTERVIFDRALPFERTRGMKFCIFQQAQLSPAATILYLVSPVDASSNSMAIVDLKTSRVKYVSGVEDVYVIRSGPHQGDLMYMLRTLRDNGVRYPWVHARADASQIHVLPTDALRPDAPPLMAYLRSIGGTIMVEGQSVP